VVGTAEIQSRSSALSPFLDEANEEVVRR